MPRSKCFQGVWTALVTPFTEEGELDLPAFLRLLDMQARAGVAGVIPCGTTGEAPTLTDAERKTLIQTSIDALRGTPIKVVAGTGGNDTRSTVELSRWASGAGVDGVLVVTPYYNKPTATGLERHFRAVADAVNCEVILYNVPGRTGVSLRPETIVTLAAHPRITALKEATGNVAFTSEILHALSRAGLALDILSGDDATFLPLMAVGAVGVVSVASNVAPAELRALHTAFQGGDVRKAASIHDRLYPLLRDLFVESNPGPVKYALERQRVCSTRLRLPLAELSPASAAVVDAALAASGVSAK